MKIFIPSGAFILIVIMLYMGSPQYTTEDGIQFRDGVDYACVHGHTYGVRGHVTYPLFNNKGAPLQCSPSK